MKRFLGLSAAAILGGFVAMVAYQKMFNTEPVVKIVERTPIQYTGHPMPSSAGNMDFTGAADRTVNAVVHIQTLSMTSAQHNPWAGTGRPQTLRL